MLTNLYTIFIRVWKKKLLNQPNKTLRICYRLIHDDFATIRKEKFKEAETSHIPHTSGSAHEFELESVVLWCPIC